jgi:hypothetical protein
MTEFKQELRHYCRNPKCRSKLPTPVANPREAFCARGCYRSVYLKRCVVCEGPIERKRDDQKVCRKAKCRSAWRAGSGFGCYAASSDAKLATETPDSIGPTQPLKTDRSWRIVAGAELTPGQLRAATVPDGPDCQWKDGEFERIEAKNRKLLEQHFAKLDAMATDHCAACGTDEDLIDHKPDPNRPERTVTLCRTCRDKGREYVATARPDLVIPADLSIPAFLCRTPPREPEQLLAA